MIKGTGDSPQYALDRLDINRISLAREFRGLTKKELAQKTNKSPSAISQIERGLIRPDLETFVRISMALGVPTTFFIKRDDTSKPIEIEGCHFRSRASTSQIDRRQSARKGDLLIDLIELLEDKGVIFPEDQVSQFSSTVSSTEEIESVATDLRKQWDMGYGPIPNIVKLIESRGVIVLPLHESCDKVDAYSTWRGKRACIFLSQRKSASRNRFDAAHELGHLILHEDKPGDSQTEREANRFAGAFLAPREGFLPECPRRWSLAAFRRLKDRWKLSIGALLMRAKDLGIMSQSSVQRAFIDLKRRNLWKDEGPEWPMEKPTLIEQALILLKDRVSLDSISLEMTIYKEELKDLMRSCVEPRLINQLDTPDENLGQIVKIKEKNTDKLHSS